MKVSFITSNKSSTSSEHLKFDLIPWIILQSPGKPPQFTKHLSSVHPKGNTQLQNRKWWIPLISELYLSIVLIRPLSIPLNKQHKVSNKENTQRDSSLLQKKNDSSINSINTRYQTKKNLESVSCNLEQWRGGKKTQV